MQPQFAESVPREFRDRVSSASKKWNTLEAVLRWAHAQSPAGEVKNVVVQDEFTHDVVIELEGGQFLVFDST